MDQCPEGETLDRLAQAVDDADAVFKDHTVDDTGGCSAGTSESEPAGGGTGGGVVAERGVEAARVVPALDPLEHGPVEPGAGRPPPTASTGAIVAQGARPTVTDPAF